MGDRVRVVAALEALPPRVWGLVLREVRTLLEETGAGGGPLHGLVVGPRSAVAGGPGRTRVAALLADDPTLLATLAGRPVLADAAAALTAGTSAAADEGVPADGAGPVARSSDPATGDRATEAGRDLRAELARTRRQRDGADARARAAEERAERAEDEVAALRARLTAAEATLAEAEEDRARAVERAERRTADRVRELEDELAALRGERERLGRDLEREQARTARLRGELETARAGLAAATATAVPDVPLPRRPVGIPDGVAPDTTEAARHLLGAVDLVIVDGYNLTLRARADLELAAQRRWLLDRLRPVAARGPRVVVVFDGDRASGTRRSDAGVEVVFTPERRIADDEIEFVAGEAAAGGTPTLVVTDDAELRRRVAAHDADVVAVVPFVGALG